MWLQQLRRLLSLPAHKPAASRRKEPARARRRTAWLALERLEDRTVPSVLPVTKLVDSPLFQPGDGSLRGEIAAAQDGDTVQFSIAGLLTLDGTQIELSKSVTIADPTPNVTINGVVSSRVFQVDAGVTATLFNLTIDNGLEDTDGGAILNDGTLRVNTCRFDNNIAYGNGGVLMNHGAATLSACFFANNGAAGDGGIVFNASGATLTMGGCATSAIDSNVAQNNGGALANAGTATVTGCNFTLDDTNQGNGGAIDNSGTLTLSNSVLSYDTVAQSGGLANEGGTATVSGCEFTFSNVFVSGGTVFLVNSTINQTGVGVGSAGGAVSLVNCTITQCRTGIGISGGAVTLANTLVGNNTADITGPVTANYSLIGNTSGATISGSGNVLNQEPSLSLLGSYGGTTQTYIELPGSPSLGAGATALAVDASGQPLTGDQRGDQFPRVYNGKVDIGASEAISAHLVVSTTADENDGDYSYGHLSLREAVALVNTYPFGINNTITFAPAVFATPQTIALTGGTLTLTSRVAITGPTAGLTIQGDNHGYAIQNVSIPFCTHLPMSLADLTITGGGVLLGGNSDSLATLTQCTISGNNGNGVEVDGGTASLSQCTISSNNGSGVYDNTATVTLTGCTFTENKASAIYNYLGSVAASDCTLSNNSNNSQVYWTGGGALYSDGTATLTHCTLSQNSAAQFGGGILSIGDLTLTDCTLSDNAASQGGALAELTNSLVATGCSFTHNSANTGRAIGGGILNDGAHAMTLTACTLSDNSASTGGGIEVDFANGTTSLIDCTLSGNSASGNGGAIDTQNCQFGALVVSGCTIADNAAADGGGVSTEGAPCDPVILTNTTVIGNSASDRGGAIYNLGNGVALTNCTVTANQAGPGGAAGIFFSYSGEWLYYAPSTVLLRNTILAGNLGGASATTPDDLGGDPDLANYSLIGNTAGVAFLPGSGNNLIGVDPQLGSLADNGGPTLTVAPLPGSPVIDAGSKGLATVEAFDLPNWQTLEVIRDTGTPVTTDQRGLPRIVNGTVDIGAVELQQPAITATTVSAPVMTYGANGVVTVTVSSASATPTGSVTLSVDGGPAVLSQALSANGTATFTIVSPAAGHHTLAATYLAKNNFTGSSATGNWHVNQAALVVQANPATKVYGQTAANLSGTVTGVVNGDPITASFSSTGTAVDADAGSYPITAQPSDGGSGKLNNYSISIVAGTLTVTPADQTPTWPAPSAIIYGTPLSAAQLDATVSVVGPAPAGALMYSPAAGTILTAGAGQTLTATAAATIDYHAASANVTIDVSQATPTVTVTDAGGTYNGSSFPGSASVAGVNGVFGASLEGVSPTLTYYAGSTANGTPLSGPPLVPGTYTVAATFAGSLDYTSAGATVTFTVTPVPLTITADNKTMVYGGNLPILTASYAGFINGDTAASLTNPVIVSTAATQVSPAGTYAITPSAASDPDYTITFVNGILSVLPALATVTSPTIDNLTLVSATLGGTAVESGGVAITRRGVLYAPTATNAQPALGGNGVIEVDDAASSFGSFTESIVGLAPGTSYCFVAFATNSAGTSYTNPVYTFNTPAPAATISDADFGGDTLGVRGQTRNLSLAVNMPQGAAALTNVSYQVDWNDGTVSPYTGTSAGVPASHVYKNAGTFTIAVTAALNQTGPTVFKPIQIDIADVQPVAIPGQAGPFQALIVGGNTGGSTILITEAASQLNVQVSGADSYSGTFPAGEARIILLGQGADSLAVDRSVTIDAEIYSSSKNSKLQAGSGNDLLVGGGGNDTIAGGAGADIIIGGQGKDILRAGSGLDIVIASSTSHDHNAIALRSLLIEWTSSDCLSAKYSAIQNGTGATGGYKLTYTGNPATGTVLANLAVDQVYTGAGTDWFFVDFVGTGPKDVIFGTAAEMTNI